MLRLETERKTSLASVARAAAYAVAAAISICIAWQSALTLFASYDEKSAHQDRMNDLAVSVENIDRIRSGLPTKMLPSGFKTQAEATAIDPPGMSR